MTMTHHEKWEYERDLDEISDRLSRLLVKIVLVSIKKIHDPHSFIEKRYEKITEDLPF